MTDYVHTDDVHTLRGARRGLDHITQRGSPGSLLDVGCGTGTWLKAARDAGIGEVRGVEGSEAACASSGIGEAIVVHDLTAPFNLERRFDIAICLEVAEHLPETSAAGLVRSLCRHSDEIFFSAACPQQFGQNHINCQWPEYWQALFNQEGFACDDEVRWRMWSDTKVEPWYRQNMFRARRDEQLAGAEPRIAAVLHPHMLPYMVFQPPPGPIVSRVARRLSAAVLGRR